MLEFSCWQQTGLSLSLALLCGLACNLQAAPLSPHPHTEAFFNRCSGGDDWIRYRDSCYRFFETSEYWYLAEMKCRGHSGHLVSIGDQSENAFIAKLTYCQSAWTGRYAVRADRLDDPSNYRWSDGSSGGAYHAHNFSAIRSVHEPLISVANLMWHNNVYHTKDRYICEVNAGNVSAPAACPPGWKSLNGYCYLMPGIKTTWIEANYYCDGRDAHLVSVHTEPELRALSLLDLDTYDCPASVWIGLVKINPCIPDMFTSQPICYKWSDRRTDFYHGFPAWHPGHPDHGEEVNCVLLEGRAIKTVQCHERHRFVCKKSASSK